VGVATVPWANSRFQARGAERWDAAQKLLQIPGLRAVREDCPGSHQQKQPAGGNGPLAYASGKACRSDRSGLAASWPNKSSPDKTRPAWPANDPCACTFQSALAMP